MKDSLKAHLPNSTTLTKAAIAGVVSVLSAMAVIAAFTAYLSLTGRLNSSISPIVYAAKEIYPANEPLCPGDVLEWVEEYIATDAPARVSQYYEVRNMVTGDKMPQPDGSPIGNYLVVPGDVGKTFTQPMTFTVPTNSEPGSYVYWRYAQAIGRRPEAYKAVFEVKRCG